MDQNSDGELRAAIAQLREEIRGLSARLAGLEQRVSAAPTSEAAAVSGAQATAPVAAPPTPRQEIGEEELLAISAAVAAYLGVRAHIRQVRLIHSAAWAQVGRVTVQASHRLR